LSILYACIGFRSSRVRQCPSREWSVHHLGGQRGVQRRGRQLVVRRAA
jgi:hypothetical protein